MIRLDGRDLHCIESVFYQSWRQIEVSAIYQASRLRNRVIGETAMFSLLAKCCAFCLQRNPALHLLLLAFLGYIHANRMSKPSILIVPGSFTPGHAYNNLVEKVAARGYDIRALQMPSVRLETESPTARMPPSMYEDAAFIASQATALADEGKDVVIISHSYGGVPTTECVKGLAKDARQKLGKQGGIVRLAYMTSLVPALGSSAGNVLDLGERSEDGRLPMEMDVSYSLLHRHVHLDYLAKKKKILTSQILGCGLADNSSYSQHFASFVA